MQKRDLTKTICWVYPFKFSLSFKTKFSCPYFFFFLLFMSLTHVNRKYNLYKIFYKKEQFSMCVAEKIIFLQVFVAAAAAVFLFASRRLI